VLPERLVAVIVAVCKYFNYRSLHYRRPEVTAVSVITLRTLGTQRHTPFRTGCSCLCCVTHFPRVSGAARGKGPAWSVRTNLPRLSKTDLVLILGMMSGDYLTWGTLLQFPARGRVPRCLSAVLPPWPSVVHMRWRFSSDQRRLRPPVTAV